MASHPKLKAGLLLAVFMSTLSVLAFFHVGQALASDGRIRAGILDYARSDANLQTWMQKRFYIKIGGDNSGKSDMIWTGYFNFQGVGSPKLIVSLKDFGKKMGVVPEDLFLHYEKDTLSKVNVATRGIDKFDVFEGKNGVLLSDDMKKFTDVTDRAYNAETRLSYFTVIGYEEPFAKININVSRVNNPSNTVWQYWNGSSWARLNVKDSTDGLRKTGSLDFIPPADWKRLSLNESRPKYFVRLQMENGKSIVTARIFGESWANENESACRGWDKSAPGIVNSGELAFNPNPPSHARARFRYQSRIPFWAPLSAVANVGYQHQVGGRTIRPWSLFATEMILDLVKEKGYNGMMCDDVLASDPTYIKDTDWKGGPYREEMKKSYKATVDEVHSRNKSIFIGGNIPTADLAFLGDFNAIEFISTTIKSGMPRAILPRDQSTLRVCYDDYLPQNNPNKVLGYLVYDDTADIVIGLNIPWDRGNRGPIVALSKHLIAMNENTIFGYYSRGGYIYNERDEVVLKDGKVLHMASDPLPKLEDVKRWAQWFPAMAVDFGNPDPKGFNGGVRSLEWKMVEKYKLPVWRRDFTKAIVLHIAAVPSTPTEAYQTPSFEADLGGTYYPLLADGSTGPAISKISLRVSEGAILMKAPLSRPSR